MRKVVLAWLFLCFTGAVSLLGVEIPVETSFWGHPKGVVSLRVEDGKLLLSIAKTEKKITYASFSVTFPTPQDWSDFRDVRFSIRSSQKVYVRCLFGQPEYQLANDWPRWTVGPERKQVLFEKSLFKPMKEKEVLLSSVKYFAIGLGLWGYDTTRETAEIEIEGIQVTQPSDVFVIPRPTASVSIDGAYQKDWGFQDALYFWTPPAYCTLGAQQRVSKGERPSSKLSARYSLMYDDKNIYFLSLVTDPTPFQGGRWPSLGK